MPRVVAHHGPREMRHSRFTSYVSDMPPPLTSKEIHDAFRNADWCVRTLMPLVLELVGQQRWADQLRALREVQDDASAAAALAAFSKLMRNYPDARWATDGWWALQHAGKTLERREGAAYCRRLALGQALSFARDTWLNAECQRWTAKAAKAKVVYEQLKAAQI
jgi:hypothetical protein